YLLSNCSPHNTTQSSSLNMTSIHYVIVLLLSLSVSHISFAITTKQNPVQTNPFTPKASLIRYWNTHISNTLQKPTFLISKASPLNHSDSAFFTNLATHNTLSSHFHSFCSLANLYCFSDQSSPYPDSKSQNTEDANFAVYSHKQFSNYGSSRLGGVDSFKNYSNGLNSISDSFKKYTRSATGHSEQFANYGEDGNVAVSDFGSYAADSTGGSGDFKNYNKFVNVPNLGFTNYNSDSNNHKLAFSSYGNETNSGTQSFTSYGENGNGAPSEFNNYGDSSNIVQSVFSAYGESGNGANDSFKAYGFSGNNPHNNFKSYGSGSNSGTDSFSSYRTNANVGDDTFQSYAREANSGTAAFSNYGKSFNIGNDTFKGYGKGSVGRTTVGFKSYGLGRTFKDYVNKGISFSEYNNFSSNSVNGKVVNKWLEQGKFFRELMLKEGNVMVMADIRDKMPKRSFLPRPILSKLPFSSSRLAEMKEIFHAREKSAMERVLVNALAECERTPSPGETKRCVGTAEDMIDFAVSVLGSNVVARATENVSGSGGNVMIGKVNRINGGNLTTSVSCHQSLYPYLLYYCHSVPKVRVYEVDIVDLGSKVKINHGVAICHIDTSSWGPEHGAFVALGSSPGKIEVCHWIFENDMNWTIAD
ncbi:putative Polygalacturonase-1 non-catalytic subunit beta, partial [Quillaja saponaria]